MNQNQEHLSNKFFSSKRFKKNFKGIHNRLFNAVPSVRVLPIEDKKTQDNEPNLIREFNEQKQQMLETYKCELLAQKQIFETKINLLEDEHKFEIEKLQKSMNETELTYQNQINQLKNTNAKLEILIVKIREENTEFKKLVDSKLAIGEMATQTELCYINNKKRRCSGLRTIWLYFLHKVRKFILNFTCGLI